MQGSLGQKPLCILLPVSSPMSGSQGGQGPSAGSQASWGSPGLESYALCNSAPTAPGFSSAGCRNHADRIRE